MHRKISGVKRLEWIGKKISAQEGGAYESVSCYPRIGDMT
jgi:hypothetical protein